MCVCSDPKPEQSYLRQLTRLDLDEDGKDSLKRFGSGLDKYRPPKPSFLYRISARPVQQNRKAYHSFSTASQVYRHLLRLSMEE